MIRQFECLEVQHYVIIFGSTFLKIYFLDLLFISSLIMTLFNIRTEEDSCLDGA